MTPEERSEAVKTGTPGKMGDTSQPSNRPWQMYRKERTDAKKF